MWAESMTSHSECWDRKASLLASSDLFPGLFTITSREGGDELLPNTLVVACLVLMLSPPEFDALVADPDLGSVSLLLEVGTECLLEFEEVGMVVCESLKMLGASRIRGLRERLGEVAQAGQGQLAPSSSPGAEASSTANKNSGTGNGDGYGDSGPSKKIFKQTVVGDAKAVVSKDRDSADAGAEAIAVEGETAVGLDHHWDYAVRILQEETELWLAFSCHVEEVERMMYGDGMGDEDDEEGGEDEVDGEYEELD